MTGCYFEFCMLHLHCIPPFKVMNSLECMARNNNGKWAMSGSG